MVKPLRVGDKVIVHFWFSDPIEAVVVTEESLGWIEVEEDFMGKKNRFYAIPEKCERI